MRVAGIDGWKKRWVVVFLNDGVFDGIRVFPTLEEAAKQTDAQKIGLDVPIGLPETPPRLADQAARAYLRGRIASSVFPAPPAFCLSEDWSTRQQASDEANRRFGIGIGAQTFSLMKNIRDADKVARSDARVFEVHPEVSFCFMNNQEPLRFSKKSWNGQSERLKLLSRAGIDLPTMLEGDAGEVSVDDILDAAAGAWSANRIANCTEVGLPNKDQRFARIWV